MGRRTANALPQIRCHTNVGGYRSAAIYINGHKHHLGPWGSAKSEERYHRIVAEWLASGRSRTYGLPQHELAVAELATDYLRHCEAYYGTGPTSEFHPVGRMLRTLVELYGSSPAAEFGPLQLKAVRQQLVNRGQARRNINANMRRIIRAFRWAAAEGRVPPSVPQSLILVPGLQAGRTPARETPPILPVDDTLVEATLPHVSEIVAAMIQFQRLTGCRPAEVCSLRPCDVDRSGDVWAYRPPRHKTAYLGRERVIFIGPHAQDVLRPYLLRPAESYCFSPIESERQRRAAVHAARKTPLMCGNRPGTNRKRRRDIIRTFGDHYNPRSYRKAVFYGCKKAQIEPWAPNRLRHSAATEIRKRFGLEAAQVVLGHSQANITQVYAERDQALAARVVKEVG